MPLPGHLQSVNHVETRLTELLGLFVTQGMNFIVRYTDMRRLTTGIRSEKCFVRRFRRCANVIECTYTNLDTRE